MDSQALREEAIGLLKDLIKTPSLSKEEDKTAELLFQFLEAKGIVSQRSGNNVYTKNASYNPELETILLNSHHDTVKPNAGYTRDPYAPQVEDGKLYGLGSNDAGASLVSLIACFLHFYQEDLPFNLVLACTAEEENSGKGGVESILGELGPLHYGIVGEPTEMKMAVAEKGLMVLDCTAYGQSGHAARDIGKNAIYEAVKDIEKIRKISFGQESALLGPVKLSVTQINAGYQHNVIPDRCHYVVDVRTTDTHTNEEVLDLVKSSIGSEVKARSTRLRPSKMPEDTPIFEVSQALDIEIFGSATTSDQAVIPIPTIKMGPGRSERSHTPDEFIFLHEIEQGITGYVAFIETLKSIYQA